MLGPDITGHPGLSEMMGKCCYGLGKDQRKSEESDVLDAKTGRSLVEMNWSRRRGVETQVDVAKGCHFLACRISLSLIHTPQSKCFC